MSVESISRALWVPGLVPSEKLLLVGIANHDGDGGAWPAVATLSAYVGCSDRRIQQVLARLVTAGLISVDHNAGGSAHTRSDRRPNRYILHLPTVDKCRNGVKPVSPRTADGVKSGASRGEILVVNGVKPTSPETSFKNRPIERAPEPVPTVDNARLCIVCDRPLDESRLMKTRCLDCQTEMDELRERRIANEGAEPA